jgi:predicted DNA-binding protein
MALKAQYKIAMLKKPIQIYLDDRQHRALKAIARNSGSSIAALVRESIERYLEAIPIAEDPAMRIVALGGGGPRDLARNHNKYLAQIYTEENQ